MAITEKDRHELYRVLEATIGPDPTATMMAFLPPLGWGDVATKADIEGLRVATKADIEGLRVATKADIEGLRFATKADIDATKADIAALRVEMDLKFMAQEQSLRAYIATQTRAVVLVVVVVMAALVGAVDRLS